MGTGRHREARWLRSWAGGPGHSRRRLAWGWESSGRIGAAAYARLVGAAVVG